MEVSMKKQSAPLELASRYLGIGARRRSRQGSPHQPPPQLPLGHPHMGLRNRWYLLCRSDELRSGPLDMRVLGEDVVLWRDASGAPRVMTDRCPHRGARLSLGDVVDGQLQCWYHHWRFDGTGQCLSVPSQGGACKLAERTRVAPVYPTVERAGFVWSWIGDAEPAELGLPHEFEDPTYSMFPETVTWGTNWRLALENLADIMHAPFLHSKSLTLSRGLVADRVTVSDTSDGFRVERKGQKGVNFDWGEIGTGPLLYVRLDIPYPNVWAAGPGPALRILCFATPIDEANTVIHFPRFRQVSGWRRRLWRALYRVRLRGTHMHVLNQDKVILESLGTIERATRDEHFAQSDRPVVHLRRVLQPAFDAQFDALRADLGEQSDTSLGGRPSQHRRTPGDPLDVDDIEVDDVEEADDVDDASDEPGGHRAGERTAADA
jgi:phenylpropionate dioxygenase-like ring-hydroxylating dioxygenase large terminal subunit